MRDDYNEIYKDTATERRTAKQEIQTALQSALVGIAEWIGMGDWIRGKIERTDKFKGMKQEDVNNMKAKLTARINSLIQQGDIDLSKLEDKLAELSNLGFSLTGVARQKYSKYVADIEKARDNQRIKNVANQAWATKMQTKVDSLKGVYDTLDAEELESTGKRIKQIEKEIGNYGN